MFSLIITHVHTCVCMCVWRPGVDIACLYQMSTFCFTELCLSVAQNLSISLQWQSSYPQESSCLCNPSPTPLLGLQVCCCSKRFYCYYIYEFIHLTTAYGPFLSSQYPSHISPPPIPSSHFLLGRGSPPLGAILHPKHINS